MLRGRLFSYVQSVRDHPLYYAAWMFLLLMGFSCGFASMKLFSTMDGNALHSTITSWLEGYVYNASNIASLLLSALLTHGRWLLLLILSGLFRFGSFFVFAVPIVKGFGMGTISGMLYVAFGIGGIGLSAVALCLQNLFLIPCFAYTGTIALIQIQTHAVSRHASRRYMDNLIPAFIFFAVALIIECSILPWVIRWLGSHYV